jgi:hypothetical protein
VLAVKNTGGAIDDHAPMRLLERLNQVTTKPRRI